jgi:hypothetical protein
MPLFKDVAVVKTSNKTKKKKTPFPFNLLTKALAANEAKNDMKKNGVKKKFLKLLF